LLKLTCLDVCICLGLSASDEDVDLDSELWGDVGLLFPTKEIKINDIIERMRELVSEANHVDSVCRLYVLLCFVVLHFPRTSRTITNMPFSSSKHVPWAIILGRDQSFIIFPLLERI